MARLGDAEMLTIPGELHPELAIGGYDGSQTPGGVANIWSPGNQEPSNLNEAPAGPYLRDLMEQRVKFVFGLTQDFLGYILPHFNFKLEPTNPYLSEPAIGDHYEETNSTGPMITDVINDNYREMSQELHAGQ